MTCTRMNSIYHFKVETYVSCHWDIYKLCIISYCLFMLPFPIGTFVGVGVGVAMFFLLVLLTALVVLILAVVVERRKRAHKQKRSTTLRDNLWCDNSVVVEQEMEMKTEGVTADNGDGYEDVDYDKGEDDAPFEDVFNHYEFDNSMEHIMNTKAPAPKDNDQSEDDDDQVEDDFNPYEVVDRKEHIKNTKTTAHKDSSTPVSATSVTAIYAVVDKSKKKAIREVEEGSTVGHEDQYAMPMENHGKITDTGEGAIVCVGVEEEQYDDTVAFWNRPQAESKPCQPSEGDYNC